MFFPKIWQSSMWSLRTVSANYLGFVLVVIVAALPRLGWLANVNGLVFDEKYYQREAYTLLVAGYELLWPQPGQPMELYADQPSFSVHPPFGKWVIAFFMQIFGPMSPQGFRMAAAVCGIVTVIAIMLTCALLTQKILWANVAGLLLALDGLSISMSRVAMLDGIMTALLAVGFLFLIMHLRRRAEGHKPRFFFSWLIPAGLAFGFAMATKWSAVPFIILFLVVVILFEWGLLRATTLSPSRMGATARSIGALLQLAVSATVAYLWSWSGWFAGTYSWGRYAAEDPANRLGGILAWLPIDLQSFIIHHIDMATRGANLSTDISQASHAVEWPLMLNPVLMAFERNAVGSPDCPFPTECVVAMSTVSNPLVWFPAVASVILASWFVIKTRSIWGSIILAGVVAGYVPWLFLQRDEFFFYAVALVPFLVLSLVWVFGEIVTRAQRADQSRRIHFGIGIYVILASACGIFFLPLAMYISMPSWFWDIHVWLPGWNELNFILNSPAG
jgi:dolichyl-phosphate-mannose-protein mannosyltransferase